MLQNRTSLFVANNLLKFGHLHDDDKADIALVREAVDRRAESIDFKAVMEHGGRKFLEEWREMQDPGARSQ